MVNQKKQNAIEREGMHERRNSMKEAARIVERNCNKFPDGCTFIHEQVEELRRLRCVKEDTSHTKIVLDDKEVGHNEAKRLLSRPGILSSLEVVNQVGIAIESDTLIIATNTFVAREEAKKLHIQSQEEEVLA